MSFKFNEPTQRRTLIIIIPMDTSYETIWAADLMAPKKGYFEFEDHNIKDIIQKSNGYKLDKKHILLTTQCKKCPSLTKYTYLESYGAWRRIWTEEELDNMSLGIVQEPEIENACEIVVDMIMPTQEEYLGYWKKLTDYIYTCNYSSPTSPGSKE